MKLLLILVLITVRSARAPVGERLSDADYAQHVEALRKKIPAGFSIVVQRPFVVVGDESAAQLRRYATGTVKWAVDHLKKDYFSRDPGEIIDIYLFKDSESYRRYTKELFDDSPDTPYGYYSPGHRALIMNIATGGGTLVHEIVHPFMRANFPQCPAWLNEGMGSLYEQSAERDGHIAGLTNWRLAGLQKAIAAKRVGTFEELLGTSDGEFYGEKAGVNYAQARYLCYYLQEKGLLVNFYHDFVKGHEEDPGGVKTLKKVLGRADLKEFQGEWEGFVMGLKFP